MNRFSPLHLAPLALCLAGCLPWGQEDDPKVFRVHVSGYARMAPARAMDGSASTPATLGVEAADSGALALDPFALPEPAPPCTTTATTLCPGSFIIRAGEPYALIIGVATSSVMKRVPSARLATLTPKEIERLYTHYRGMPCRFSDPRAFRLSGSDTVELVADRPRLSIAGDSIRFTFSIDSAASEAGDARANLAARPWIQASARATCP